MITKQRKQDAVVRRRALRPAAQLVAMTAAMLASEVAGAFELQIDNPDVAVRWDNSVRYNLGIRAKDCDKNICGDGTGLAGDFTGHQSDRRFGSSGDIVTNRVDLLSELDFVYKQTSGFRVSATAWYDAAYNGAVTGDRGLESAYGSAGQGAGPSGSAYTDYTNRWNRGVSGQFLDAFVFTRLDVGGVPINVKLGQHNIYWGESLFSFSAGVSNSQGPVDVRKAAANPGSEAKELFSPLNQASFVADLTDRLSLAGQYYLDWKPTTLPDGGTYFGAADGLSIGGGGNIAGIPFAGITGMPEDKRGDFGISVKWRPEWLNGTAGFYYRKYTDRAPAVVFDVSKNALGLDYSRPRTTMYAFSLSKAVGDVSVGMDLTYREDAALGASFGTPAGGSLGNSLLPTGKVVSGVVNAIAYVGSTPAFDSAVIQAEMSFAKLLSVSKNPGTFQGEGYNCPAKAAGKDFPWQCVTKQAFGLDIAFVPKWFQVMPGVDLEMPMFISYGLKGNSAVAFGPSEGQGAYSVGLSADVRSRYKLSLSYNGFIAKHDQDSLGAASNSNAGLGKSWDRDWVSFTFKTTF